MKSPTATLLTISMVFNFICLCFIVIFLPQLTQQLYTPFSPLPPCWNFILFLWPRFSINHIKPYILFPLFLSFTMFTPADFIPWLLALPYLLSLFPLSPFSSCHFGNGRARRRGFYTLAQTFKFLFSFTLFNLAQVLAWKKELNEWKQSQQQSDYSDFYYCLQCVKIRSKNDPNF